MRHAKLRTAVKTIAAAVGQIADDAETEAVIAGAMRHSELSILQMDKSQRDEWAASDFIKATDNPHSLMRVYYCLVRQFVKRIVGGEENSDYAVNYGEDAEFVLYNELSDSKAQEIVRVKKVTGGYTVYMPCSGTIGAGLAEIYGASYYRQDYKPIKQSIEHALPGFFDLESPLDVSLGRNVLNDTNLEVEGFEIDPDALKAIKKGLRGIRVVGSPSRDRFIKQLSNPDRLRKWDEDDFQGDGYGAALALNSAWTTRAITFFAEFFIPEAGAEYITQEKGDRIRLSALGEYFGNTQDTLFGTGKALEAPHVISMRRIAADNVASGVTPIPRVDEFGLSVSQQGELYWIPDQKDPSFAEDSVEAGGMMPTGEWTMQDAIDPAANEFIQDTDAHGHLRRKLKPRGRNLLVYTDWHNSKLAYTQSDSRLKVLDISMFRPAAARQYARVLNQDLTAGTALANDILNSLTYVIDRGKSLGVQLQAGEQFEDGYLTAEETEQFRHHFKEGKLPLEELLTLLNYIKDNGATTDNRELTPAQFQFLESYVQKHRWPSINMLSADSPVGFVRAMYQYFSDIQTKFNDNPDLAFGEYSVVNTLGMIAYLRVVVSLGGQHEAVNAKDLEDRKLYLHPPLDAPDQIRVEGIPWVSGSVELMPHQVKAWNYMQHFPKNLVLSVQAGGGKTLLALLYAAYGLGKGVWKKPLVLCPGNLIKNYIIDASWLFKGKMNIVVINNTTVNSKEWGEEKLLQLIEHSPLNTIFISDYDFVVPKANSKRVVDYVYGNQYTQVSLNTEMLKAAAWDMVVLDESHFLKTGGSSRNREVNRLLSNIPYKVQMSGTYIADNLTDVVGEFGLLDPQTFGDKSQFVEHFYEDGIRSAPILGAQRKIREMMAEQSMYVQIERKEWAALLPRREDQFYPVEMTPKQSLVYHKLMKLAEAEFRKLLEEKAELKAALTGEEPDDEIDYDKLMESGQMGFYFQQLERFVSAPKNFPEMGPEFQLTGRDLISPKLLQVIDIIRHHLSNRTPGKILVWTQYVESAKSIYDNMPEDLKAQCVYYVAAEQDAAMAMFQQDPRKQIMIGCEKSMNTGHNLQFCSRIIRIESVWNWGTLEQGEARINRPRSDDPRKHENGGHGIFYDWVFANKSIDVTKSSRMISKLISTVKFYASDNPAYMAMDEPPPIKLSKNNIFKVNDWRAGSGNDEEDAKNGTLGCARYFDAYQRYQQLEEREFTKFREDPDNRIEPYTLEEGHIPPNSGLLVKVPYIPGMKFYGQEKLGLVPYIEWASSNYAVRGLSNWDNEEFSPEGMKVHTEYGDCVSRGYNKRGVGKPETMRVTTPSGAAATVPLAATWVITKDVVSGREIREALAKQIGAETTTVITPTAEIPVPQAPTPDLGPGRLNPADGRTPEIDPDGEEDGIAVLVEVYDNELAFVVTNADSPQTAAAMPELKKLGFMVAPNYDFAKITNPNGLTRWIAAVQKAGLKIDPPYLANLTTDAKLMATHKDLTKVVQGMSAAQRRNFFKAQMKPSPKGVIKPYLFVVTDHNNGQKAVLCLNHRGNAASLPRAKAVKASGVTAWKGPYGGELMAFVRSKQEGQTLLKKILEKFTVIDRTELIKEFNRIKLIPSKQPPAA